MNGVQKGIATLEKARRGLLVLYEAARPVIEQFQKAMQDAMPVLLAIAKEFQTLPERVVVIFEVIE